MTETHGAEGHNDHGITPYLVVFGALTGFTLISFVANYFARTGSPPPISHFTSFMIILSVAVIKATLVGVYFMHLKQDWGRLYFMIIPAFILATMLIVVLLPDIVLVWHY